MFRRTGGSPYNSDRPLRILQAAAKTTGIEGVTPHQFRHTHASKLIANGWDIAETASRLGDTIQTIVNTYVHEHNAEARRASRQTRLAALYGSAMEAQHRDGARQTQALQAVKRA